MSRGGMVALSSDDGLALFDTALRAGAPLLVPARLDLQSLSAAAESLPPLLQGLVRVTSRVSRAAASGLKQRLAGLSAAERERLLLDLVRSTSATVLSASLDSVEPERALKELGLDSLMAVELRNRLAAATGLRLPATLLFDYPTPKVLTEMLAAGLFENGAAEKGLPSAITEIDRLEAFLFMNPSLNDAERVTTRLRSMLSRWIDVTQANVTSTRHGELDPAANDALFKKIDSATNSELFELIDQTLGELGVQ
jgi:acyl carrier protein